jgi:hypothetical protein
VLRWLGGWLAGWLGRQLGGWRVRRLGGWLGGAQRQRDAEANRQALAQRAGGEVDAGELQHVRVALERRAERGVRAQRLGEVREAAQHGVERDGGVALGQDQAVAQRVARQLGAHAELSPVQGEQEVDDAQRAAVVATAGGKQRAQDLAS